MPDAGDLAASRDVANALIREHTPGEGVRVGRLCPRCGSADHGRPVVRGSGTAVFASVAYAPRLVAVALTGVGPVGVDVEWAADVTGAAARRTADTLGLPVGTRDLDVALAWTRAEAVLKATGEGLAADPSLAPDRVGADLRVLVPELGAGLVACVAVRCDRAELRQRTIRVSQTPAAPVAPGAAATRRTARPGPRPCGWRRTR